MVKRWNQICRLKTVEVRQHPSSGEAYESHTALCGRETSANWNIAKTDEAFEAQRHQCPQCAAKHYARQLKERTDVKLGERIELERWSKLRSAYPILVNGTLCGYATIKSGWGNSWRYAPISIQPDGKPYPNESRDLSNVGLPSGAAKEKIALRAAGLLAEGKIKDLPTHQRELEKREADFRASEEARRAKEAERKAARDEAAAGLESIARRDDLTNFERAALAAVYRQWTGKDLPLPAPIAIET